MFGGFKTRLLREAEIFLLPSHQENFGVAVAEAMLVGLPVVISHEVALEKDVVHAEAGLVVRLDPSDIAAATSRLLDDRTLRVSLGARGTIWAREHYDWTAIALRWTNIYERLAAGESAV
jgi:glycosyltransferase involved in cell wall biosynthesis